MLFDTHAHYDDPRFDADRDRLLASLPENGVGLVVNPGCNLASSRTAVALADRWDFIYAAVGVHPEHTGDAAADFPAELEALSQYKKVVAVGEIGLDYHYDDGPSRGSQESVFRAQLTLAQNLSLPVIVHQRDAWADCLRIVREYPDLTGVFHCFSGSMETARELLDLGWYLSFTGIVTFKNAKKAAAVAAWMPLDRLMLETDSPYLAPEPLRGRRNSSLNLRYTAECVAGLRGMPAEALEAATTENGLRFFKIRP